MKFSDRRPGKYRSGYELTRHNIGFLTLDRMADNHGFAFTTNRPGRQGRIQIQGN